MTTSGLLQKHAQQLADTWQGRVLREGNPTLQRVFLAAFAAIYADGSAIKVLLRVLGFSGIKRPFLRGYATIMPSGRIVCDVVTDAGLDRMVVYESESLMLLEARMLADKLKLSDRERRQMFDVLQKWVAADRRVGIHGERLAS